MTELFIRVRDTMINAYRLNPRLHFSCTAARRLVTVKKHAIKKIPSRNIVLQKEIKVVKKKSHILIFSVLYFDQYFERVYQR